MNNEILTSVATIKKIKPYIIEVDYKNEIEVNLKEAKEIHQVFLKICNNQPFTILIDSRNKYFNFTNEAKEFYVNDEKLIPYKIAMAMVIDSLPARIIAKFYLSFNKPFYQAKIFHQKQEAIKWLDKEYKKHSSKNKIKKSF
jgi:hypothetical protein